jgi:hypothetical protein
LKACGYEWPVVPTRLLQYLSSVISFVRLTPPNIQNGAPTEIRYGLDMPILQPPGNAERHQSAQALILLEAQGRCSASLKSSAESRVHNIGPGRESVRLWETFVNRRGQVENPDSVQAITKSYEVEVCFDAYKSRILSSQVRLGVLHISVEFVARKRCRCLASRISRPKHRQYTHIDVLSRIFSPRPSEHVAAPPVKFPEPIR